MKAVIMGLLATGSLFAAALAFATAKAQNTPQQTPAQRIMGDIAPKLAKATGSSCQPPHNEDGPFVGDPVERDSGAG